MGAYADPATRVSSGSRPASHAARVRTAETACRAPCLTSSGKVGGSRRRRRRRPAAAFAHGEAALHFLERNATLSGPTMKRWRQPVVE
jgi:hypothetical protein